METNPNASTGNPPSELAPDEDNTAPIGQGPLQPPAPNAGATNTPETQGTSGTQSSTRQEHETSELALGRIMSDAETPRRVLKSEDAVKRHSTGDAPAIPPKRARSSKADVVDMGAAVNVAIEDYRPENIEAHVIVIEGPQVEVRAMGGVDLSDGEEVEQLVGELQVVAVHEEVDVVDEAQVDANEIDETEEWSSGWRTCAVM